MSIRTQFFPLAGGMDFVTPPIQTPAGRVIAGENYEPDPRGYRRIDGIERYSGKPKPSEASYWVIDFDYGSAAIAEGDTVTGGSSSATGVALIDAVVTSGSYVGGDAAGYLVLTAVSGTFQDNENLQVSGVTKSKANGTATERGASNDTDHATWLQDAIETARTAISAPSGSGPVRGVHVYNGSVYCVRDNAGGTAGVLYKATTAGWVAQSLGFELAFTAGGYYILEFNSGSELSPGTDGISVNPPYRTSIWGADSGATCEVIAVNVTSGSWATNDAAGTLHVIQYNGTAIQPFYPGEDIDLSSDGLYGGNVATVVAWTGTVQKIAEGDTIEGDTSGATATVARVTVESGAWEDGDAAGTIVMASKTGTFQAEGVNNGGESDLITIAGDATANALPAGGRYQFVNYNFFGTSDYIRMYGVNGVGRGFEWDGTIFTPINTGVSSDIPTRVAAHNNHLFFSYEGGSVQHSSTGNPYEWSVLTGAGEITIGEDVTDMLPGVSGTLTIFGKNKVAVLFGNDSSDWALKTIASDAGAVAWTGQMIGSPIYLDAGGLRSLETTQNFGDFRVGTITQLLEPLFKSNAANGVTAVGSIRVRSKDQYRLFWSDGTGLTVYFGRQQPEALPFDLGVVVSCVAEGEDSSGDEILFIGTSTGMVYQVDSGTSLDGSEIEAFLRLPFNHVGSPTQKKRWQKVTIECDADQDTTLGLTTEFSYSHPDNPYESEQTFTVTGGGGNWSESSWDEISWSQPYEGQAEAHIDGLGNNLSVVVISNATYQQPHLLHGLILHYSIRGLVR